MGGLSLMVRLRFCGCPWIMMDIDYHTRSPPCSLVGSSLCKHNRCFVDYSDSKEIARCILFFGVCNQYCHLS